MNAKADVNEFTDQVPNSRLLFACVRRRSCSYFIRNSKLSSNIYIVLALFDVAGPPISISEIAMEAALFSGLSFPPFSILLYCAHYHISLFFTVIISFSHP